jgi:hypothetical protein
MAEGLGALLLVVLVGVTLIALFATLSLLLPGAAGRSRAVLELSPWRAFWLGLVNLVFFLAIAAALAGLADLTIPIIGSALGLLALLILVGLVIVAALGLTGLVMLLNERIGAAPSPLAGMIRAGALLVLAALTPFVGWWVFAPLALIVGLGAGILSIVRRTSPVPASVDPTLSA